MRFVLVVVARSSSVAMEKVKSFRVPALATNVKNKARGQPAFEKADQAYSPSP